MPEWLGRRIDLGQPLSGGFFLEISTLMCARPSLFVKNNGFIFIKGEAQALEGLANEKLSGIRHGRVAGG
jgi:hypothetical protein